MSSDSFAVTYAPLISQIRAARDQGDDRAARLALDVLLRAYVRLGNRELGTMTEQTNYIVTRHLGHLPEVLQELGVADEDLPRPPGRRRPSPPPARGPSSAEDAERIAEHFAHVGAPEGPTDRFTVAVRPQDNMRYDGRPAPYAVVDSQDGLPVAWYPESDWAAIIADTASRMRRSD